MGRATLWALLLGGSAGAAPQETAYDRHVRPLLAKHCFSCHGAAKPKAGLDLESVRDDVPTLKVRRMWKKVADLLHAEEMPPLDQPRPTPAERERMAGWAESVVRRPPPDGRRDPGPSVLRRLNRIEYNNTLFDLFRAQRPPRIPFDPARGMPDSLRYRHGDYAPRILVDLPADEVAHGYTTMGEALSLPPFLMERYLRAARDVVAQRGDAIDLLWKQASGSHWEKARSMLASFAPRAFRRPVANAELDRLMALYDAALKAGDAPLKALQSPIQAILVSPDFLFKVEKDGPDDDPRGIRALNDFELATRLSYFLWSSMPDERLLQLAGEGKLRDPAALEAEVRRMLLSPKASELADGFGAQWLQVGSVAAHMPNPALFPAFYEGDAAKAMLVEAVLFFQTILAEDRSVLDFIDADFLWLNPQISKIYGIAPPQGKSTKGDWTRVRLSDKRRGGVLTLAAVLTVTSNGSRTSPVRRGKWLLEAILGAPPPPPLPDAGTLPDEATTPDGLSARKKLEAHRGDPRCASCHRKIDPLGFALENFDAIGRWRDADGGAPIESEGPAELKARILAKHKDAFVRCLAEHLLTYALGRAVDVQDAPAVKEIARAVEKDGYKFSRLIVEVVKCYPFQHRRNREARDE